MFYWKKICGLFKIKRIIYSIKQKEYQIVFEINMETKWLYNSIKIYLPFWKSVPTV